MSKHVKDKISLYMDGMLAGAELEAFAEHLKTCEECASQLAAQKRAKSAVKNVKTEPLPVNFMAKLNSKLDAVDEAKKKPVFGFIPFIRVSAAAFAVLLVGIFVYNIQKQTNNFSSMDGSANEQMPAEGAMKQATPPAGWNVAPNPKTQARMKQDLAKDKSAEGDDLSAFEKQLAEKKAGIIKTDVVLKAKAMKAADIKAAAPKVLYNAAAPSGAGVKSAAKSYFESGTKTESTGAEAELSASKPEEPVELGIAMDKLPAANESDGLAETRQASVQYSAGGEVPQVNKFTDEKSWEDFALRNGLKGFGEIDFTEQMVVAFYLKEMPTDGYRVEVTSVDEAGGKTVISYRLIPPPPGASVDEVPFSPGTYVVIEKTTLPLDFVRIK